jgi:hypothetical protein
VDFITLETQPFPKAVKNWLETSGADYFGVQNWDVTEQRVRKQMSSYCRSRSIQGFIGSSGTRFDKKLGRKVPFKNKPKLSKGKRDNYLFR